MTWFFTGLIWLLVLGFIFMVAVGISAVMRTPLWTGALISFVFLLALVFSGTISGEIHRAVDQYDRREKFRKDFAERCATTHNGTLVYISSRSSQLDRVCVSPDGRWLEWY